MNEIPFIQRTVISPDIVHFDINFTNKTLPFSYDFKNKTVLHLEDGYLIQRPLNNEWLKRFKYHQTTWEKLNHE